MVELLRRQQIARRAGGAAVVMAVGLVWGAEARAGIIRFEPGVTVIDPAAGDDTIVTIDLTLTHLREGEFRNIRVVVGSNDLLITSFVFSPEVLSNLNYLFPTTPHAIGIYPSDVSFRFVSVLSDKPAMPALLALPLPLPLGTLTVDASGLDPGSYELVIDSAFDNASFAWIDWVARPLSGSGTILIVPEPATLVLLGLASVAMLPRRRRR